MREYRVTVEVDYVVKAESLSEAIDYVTHNTEHPLIGAEVGYCLQDIVVKGELYADLPTLS